MLVLGFLAAVKAEQHFHVIDKTHVAVPDFGFA